MQCVICLKRILICFHRISRRIAESKLEVSQSEYFQNSLALIKEIQSKLPVITEIVCFGIGHFTDCSIARHQLGFILSVKEALNIETLTFHEPILTSSEVNLLKTLQCQVFDENLEGKVEIKSNNTLVYAPHCPKQLTNNFLWRNWNPAALSRMVYIGNSFENLISSTPNRFLEIDASFILKISPHTIEVPLENHFKFTDIFNDTSLHTLAKGDLEQLPSNFWTNNAGEPKYSDNIELITTDLISKLNI